MNFYKLLLASLFFVITPVLAQQGQGGGQRLEVLMEKLDLTDEQRASLEGCAVPGSGRQLSINLLKERTDLNDMLRNKDVADDQLRAQIERVNKAQAAWNTHRLEKMLAIRRVLTADQIGQLQDLREELGSPVDQGGKGCGFRGGR